MASATKAQAMRGLGLALGAVGEQPRAAARTAAAAWATS